MFIVPVKNTTAAEAEMNAFLRGHRVLAVKKEFVADGENSFWTFCAEYLETPAGAPAPGGKPTAVDYRVTIHDPKERVICAASFPERVLHHALMNVCEPVLERAAIFDSYACRKGKGRLRPVPDLAILSVASPSDGFSGQEFELSWTVTNQGPASAEGTWFDSVYLSLDTQFEPGVDTYIGYAERPHTLTNGQSYTQTVWLRVPASVSGLLHVFVLCDSTGRVNERGEEANNLGRASVPVAVWLHPPSDLVVGTITIPTNSVAATRWRLPTCCTTPS